MMRLFEMKFSQLLFDAFKVNLIETQLFLGLLPTDQGFWCSNRLVKVVRHVHFYILIGRKGERECIIHGVERKVVGKVHLYIKIIKMRLSLINKDLFFKKY